MALPTIVPGDFTGWLKIVANSFKAEYLQEYIDLFSEEYLRQIVGDAAYDDIDQQNNAKWTDLLNGANYVDFEGKRKYHNGLVDPLKRFIYFEFVRDNFTPTQPGKVKQAAENSDRSTDLEVLNVARNRYNAGVRLVNDSTGPFLEANKEYQSTVTASTDNLDNTYTLAMPLTKYLGPGVEVEINGVRYEVLSASPDVDITIQADQTGLDFTGDVVQWFPYEDVEYCPLEVAAI